MFEFPNIDPVALQIGPLVIRWYALAYIAGFLGGWKYCMHLAGLDHSTRPHREDIDDFLPWTILGVILGGRLGFVLFYQPGYYLQNPGEILQIWQGGMSFHGGLLGVITACFLFSRRNGIPFWSLADVLCMATPVGLLLGRIANFINGELYGRVTEVPWGIVFPNGGDAPRHASQMYEAVLEGAVLFLILYLLIRNETVRNKPGIVAGAFLAGYGIFRGFVEFFREPDAHIGLYFDLFSQGQLLSLPMIVVGFTIIVYAVISNKPKAA